MINVNINGKVLSGNVTKANGQQSDSPVSTSRYTHILITRRNTDNTSQLRHRTTMRNRLK